MNTKEELINYIIVKNGYKKYLEIGVQHGRCIERINCELKHGVDPNTSLLRTDKYDEVYNMTSDQFFRDQVGGVNDQKYDIIFIDGLHHSDQVMADLCNSIAVLEKGGTILLHDCMPESELHQEVPRRSKVWNGDVWKVFYILLRGNYKINKKFYNFDTGIAVLDNISDDGFDDLLCDFTDNLERFNGLSYSNDFEEYVKVLNEQNIPEVV